MVIHRDAFRPLRLEGIRGEAYLTRLYMRSSYCGFLNRNFSSRFVPQSRATFNPNYCSRQARTDDGEPLNRHSPSRRKRWMSLIDIMQINNYKTQRRRYHLLIWLCAASAVSGTMPLLYKAICFQEQGLLNNNPNHPLVAPVASNDGKSRDRQDSAGFECARRNTS